MPNNSETKVEVIELCDPCEWIVNDKGTKRKCGWQGRSIRAHLKSHKVGVKNETLTLDKYLQKIGKKEDQINLGPPMYSPPPEQVAKFRAASSKTIIGIDALAKEKTKKLEDQRRRRDELASEAAIEDRFEEIWAMLQKDPMYRVMAREVAEEEAAISFQREALKHLIRNKETSDKIRQAGALISTMQERLKSNLEMLNLTVEDRRKTNQLGSDTVAQLISNYQGTLRRLNPDRRDALMRRIQAVRELNARRLAERYLPEIDAVESIGDSEDDKNITSKILAFGEKL